MKKKMGTTVVAAVVAIGGAVYTQIPAVEEFFASGKSVTESGSSAGSVLAVADGAAVDVLNEIPVKGRAPKTGYDRALFGQAWSDDVDVPGGRNGCDTRNDILGRDLVDKTFKPGTGNCVVLTGTLNDPYTGRRIDFVRGPRSSEVQVDHVIALSHAWQKGAQGWDVDKRRNFANDPLNLMAVDGPTNQSKGDGDAATWLPKLHRCTYIARQIAVIKTYGLWVTEAEKGAMLAVLSRCPGQELPAADTH